MITNQQVSGTVEHPAGSLGISLEGRESPTCLPDAGLPEKPRLYGNMEIR
jgi:hypothetical protein